ncbi:nucleoside hydrolase [Novipirellula artificiosorum]|uniref:Inosine-uridine preferring nucleoside hydrolase n=1 Tax=Novipirellula artificiosorum TaxID=2528016 RepID=A0A5C6DWA2_9BACT|nr:nucleoside hydrolase [Novipirellula artificiosorum]TWU40872.1 Inosine-uridine preferring nucleoside hydrolase [Novipirellula artificiosorum]
MLAPARSSTTPTLTILTAFAVLAIALRSFPVSAVANELAPVPLIFDTDIGNDVDDVLALGVIHALQSRGECELMAVTITKDHPLAAAFTDAVNTFYGRGDVPIGVCRSGMTPEAGRFNPLAQIEDNDQLRFPHDLMSGEQAPDAVTVLRQSLAEATDHSVVIVQVGFSTNMASLLQSPADDVSPLTGVELVKQKVRLLSMMAGAFQQIAGKGGKRYDHKEYNIIKDIPSAQRIASEWPTPIVWSGFEIGIAIPYPHQSIEQDYRYILHHPLPEAYIAYNPPPHNRPTWDLTSVLAAIRPRRDYFGLSKPGRVTVADDGLTSFTPDHDGKHQYLNVSTQQITRVTEVLAALASEPPHSIQPSYGKR